jgi:acyl dehydratase
MNEYRLADLHIGLSHTFQVNISGQMIENFKELSGDINPLHTDVNFALLYGYSDRVAYGMLTASFYSTLVGVYLPGKYALLQGVDVSFTAPVFAGDSLKVHGKVSAIHMAVRQIEIRAHITNQHGKKVSRAKIRTGIHA